MSLIVTGLGQAGVRFAMSGLTVYIDPYLTDYVADSYGDALTRLLPPPVQPGDVRDADWVLITHVHADHADPTTLGPLAMASPRARFVCPPPVVPVLHAAGIEAGRIVLAPGDWLSLTGRVAVRAVPAAHLLIERNAEGAPDCVGYLLRADGRTVYHSGDTIPHPDVVASLPASGVDTAFLPVNERNYYRDAQGIVGNMSVREAIQFAREIRAGEIVPIHWDLFAPNSTPKAEIALVHESMGRPLPLRFCESGSPERLW